MLEYELFSQAITHYAASLPRIAAAFLILPLLTPQSAPPMLRNIFFASLGLMVFPFIAHDIESNSIVGLALVPVLIKEVFLGLIVGYSFSIIFWALEGAGQIIDNKIGTTIAQISDPLSGHQTSLNGVFLSQLGGYIFVAFGGLLVFIDLIFSSYEFWPVTSLFPTLTALNQIFFIERFSDLITLMLIFASPVLVILTFIEIGFGLINRYAQQLNVFTLAMSVKAWFAGLILLLMLGSLVDYIIAWMSEQHDMLIFLASILRVN